MSIRNSKKVKLGARGKNHSTKRSKNRLMGSDYSKAKDDLHKEIERALGRIKK